MIGWITTLTSTFEIEFIQSVIQTNIEDVKTKTTALPWE
jgi:hypothetical protein